MYDVIAKKRDGGELSREEIDFLIEGFTNQRIPDYQMSAWAMAVFFRGMTARETADLTMAMVQSGDKVDLQGIEGKKVDKHSTGGVGDKTTLVLVPLVAAAGVPVAKMSGRGLGHTGGTLDKLESIPGFRVNLSETDFINNVNRIKAAVVGQTGNLVPADKKLYALRDVTATVNSIPLIASSIMSKKIAAGADGIVLDVKTGSGAFMKTVDDSFELARTMVEIGGLVGRETVAFITDMDQPLGLAVGNVLEVKEAISALKGQGPEDLTELSLDLGSEMLVLAGKHRDSATARQELMTILRGGKATEKLKEMITAQGGDPKVVDEPNLMPTAQYILPVLSEQGGYVHGIDAEAIGRCAMVLGAGRETKESQIDLAVGVVLNAKRGSKVSPGDALAHIHANSKERVEEAMATLKAAYHLSEKEPEQSPLIYGKVTKQGITKF